jgi:preprotein translocase subunit Sec63
VKVEDHRHIRRQVNGHLDALKTGFRFMAMFCNKIAQWPPKIAQNLALTIFCQIKNINNVAHMTKIKLDDIGVVSNFRCTAEK